MCTASNAPGVGLRGEYFPQPGLRGTPLLTRIDDVVDFDASLRQASTAHGGPTVSVRWSGWIKAPLSGQYRFHAEAPGMKVLVARKLVAGEGAPADTKLDMHAGRFYPVEVVVDEITEASNGLRLEWTAPHGARYVVPKSLLQLPTDSVTPTRP